MTSSAAASPLTVSRPSDGGQSIIRKSYSSRAAWSARRSFSSREKAGTSSISAPARSMVAGTTKRLLHRGRLDTVLDRRVVHDDVVDRALDVAVADPEPGCGVALRVEVDDEHPETEVGERRTEIDGRSRLADPALLVGDCQDPRQRDRFRTRPEIVGNVGHRLGDLAASSAGASSAGASPVTSTSGADSGASTGASAAGASDESATSTSGASDWGSEVCPAWVITSASAVPRSFPAMDSSCVAPWESSTSALPRMRNQRRRPRRSASSDAIPCLRGDMRPVPGTFRPRSRGILRRAPVVRRRADCTTRSFVLHGSGPCST